MVEQAGTRINSSFRPDRADAGNIDPATEAANFLDTFQLDDTCRLRFWRGGWVLWERGQYRDRQASEVKGWIINFLNQTYKGLLVSMTAAVLDQVKAQAALASTCDPPTWLADEPPDWAPTSLLSLRSNLVNLPLWVQEEEVPALLPPTPRFFTQCALPFDFDCDCGAPTAWLEFLSTVWTDDAQSIGLLQEWFGYCLTPDTSQHKMLLVVGPPRSGKGTIARVLRYLIGELNYCGPTLGSLASNFGLQPLLGKTVAVVSDARLSGRTDHAVVTERLLAITGEDAVTIDRKHMEAVTAKLLTRFMILTNELPRLSESSGALAGRMLVLRMVESFLGREDMSLMGRLKAELPAILLWAIDGWRRLADRGHFEQPEASAGLIGDMKDLASPVAQFVRERCLTGPEYSVRVSHLFNEWKGWCDEKGIANHGSEQSFGRDVRATLPAVEVNQRRTEGTRHRWYDGIGIRAGGLDE